METTIGVLGPVVIGVEGRRPVAVRGRRQQLLLGLLASRAGTVVSSAELVDALWGAQLPADPLASLQSQVFRLRERLGPGRLTVETAGSGYRLHVQPDCLDAARFEALLACADAADPQRALERVEAGLRLWRGRAYADLADHEGLRAESERLEELRACAGEMRAELLLAVGRHAEVVAAMGAQAAAHPYREGPVALLMRAAAAQGRQAEALEAYAHFRSRLREDLGLDPSPALAALEGEMLRPPEATAIGLPGNSFLGREAELDELDARLRGGRLVTVTGPPGVGKTRLATCAAARGHGPYPGGVFVCELAQVAGPRDVPAAVASALRIGPTAGRTIAERIVDFLRPKRALLVLDNCEHVAGAVADLVAAVLAQTADVAVLATSRVRLGVDGEQRLPLDPLPVPVGADAACPSVTLFLDRSRAVRPRAAVDQTELAAVAELCRRLGGLPLAIELAAARSLSRAPTEINDEVAANMGLLGDRRRIVDRHRSLSAVVDWSFALLDPSEQALFVHLTVFAGGFSAEAAAAVSGSPGRTVLDGLHTLAEHSLLTVRDTVAGTRYALLEPVRQYAEEQARSQGLIGLLRDRHAAWFVRWAEAADAGLAGSCEATWIQALDAELPNLRAAQDWCMRRGDADGALRLAAALFCYAYRYGPFEVCTWAEQAIARFTEVAHPQLPRALATAAFGAWRAGDLVRAAALAERAVVAAPPAEPESARWALRVLHSTAVLAGDQSMSLAYAERLVASSAAAGDADFLTLGHTDIALALGYAGRLEEARAALDAAALVRAGHDHPTCRAFGDYVAGEILVESSPAEALALLRRARDLALANGDRLIGGAAGLSALSCAARLGDSAGALVEVRELVEHWHRLGAWSQQWITLRILIEILTGLGRDHPAVTLWGALHASSTAPPLQGGDAQRMDRAVRALRARLGADVFAAADAAGSALDDEAAYRYALETIDTAIAAPGGL